MPLPDERFGNRPLHTGASPLPVTNPAVTPNPNAPDVPFTTPITLPQLTKPIEPLTPGAGGGGDVPPLVHTAGNGGVETLPPDLIGDIPPPPIPTPPITGSGVAGIKGTEAGTLARPGQRAAAPFRTSSYAPKPQLRFGPGVPAAGGDTAAVSGLGLDPEQAAEILRQLASRGGVQ